MNDTELDDRFEQLARRAGEALRRAAPADGMRQLNRSRRRRQVAGGVAGAVAVAALVGIGALALRGDDRITSPADTLPGTAPTVTQVAPATTLPTPTTLDVPANPAPDPEPVGLALDMWVEQQTEAGRSEVDVSDGLGTTARLMIAHDPGYTDQTAAVLLDGRVVDLPDRPQSPVALARLLDRVVVVSRTLGSGGVVVDDVLEADGTWSVGPDLGLGELPAQSNVEVHRVSTSLLISVPVWEDRGDGVFVPSAASRAVVLEPDLDVRPVPAPPAGVPMSWTSSSGTQALLLGRDSAAGVEEPLTEPWAFDVATDSWAPVPLPGWLACDPQPCVWSAPHEAGDPTLEVDTPSGLIKLLPDGTIGRLDTQLGQWVQLESAPVDLAIPDTVVVDGRYLVVAPMRSFRSPTQFGTVAVLDLAAGTWTTATLPDQGVEGEQIDLRRSGMVVVAGITGGGPGLAFDGRTGEWRTPTETDAATWSAPVYL